MENGAETKTETEFRLGLCFVADDKKL